MTDYEIKLAEFTANLLKLTQSVSDKIMKQDPNFGEEQAWLLAKKLVFKSYEGIIGAIEYKEVDDYSRERLQNK
jgi:hypothetical protein